MSAVCVFQLVDKVFWEESERPFERFQIQLYFCFVTAKEASRVTDRADTWSCRWQKGSWRLKLLISWLLKTFHQVFDDLGAYLCVIFPVTYLTLVVNDSARKEMKEQSSKRWKFRPRKIISYLSTQSTLSMICKVRKIWQILWPRKRNWTGVFLHHSMTG